MGGVDSKIVFVALITRVPASVVPSDLSLMLQSGRRIKWWTCTTCIIFLRRSSTADMKGFDAQVPKHDRGHARFRGQGIVYVVDTTLLYAFATVV